MKGSSKKMLNGTVINLEKIGKKTRQGSGLRSKPKKGQKPYKGQGR